MSPDCRYLQTTAIFELGDEKFTCTGKALIEAGFTAVMTWQAITGDENMPQLTKGDVCDVSDVSCDQFVYVIDTPCCRSPS